MRRAAALFAAFFSASGAGSVADYRAAAFVPSALLPAAATPPPGTPPTLEQRFLELGAENAAGFVTLTLGGLPALPQASLGAAQPVPASTASVALATEPAGADPFAADAAHAYFRRVPIELSTNADTLDTPRLIFVEAHGASASARVFVGADFNADASAQSSEVLCSATADSVAPARCIVDLADSAAANTDVGSAWILVDAPAGAASNAIDVSWAVVPVRTATATRALVAGAQLVSGPGHAEAGADIPLRLFNRSNAPLAAGQRYFGALLIDAAAPGDGYRAGQALLLPFALTRRSASDDVAVALTPLALPDDFAPALLARPGEAWRHVFVDVPPNAAQLLVRAPAAFHLQRAEFPQPDPSPLVADAPANGARVDSAPVAGAQQVELSAANGLQPGRWYVVAPNDSLGAEAANSVEATIALAADAPTLSAGAYYNPGRSGSGAFVSQAHGVQALTWYTFFEDGTPTWYTAQASAPAVNASVWTAPLYRSTWNGAASSQLRVGYVTLTTIANDRMIFSRYLEGSFSSEPMQWIGVSGCPQVAGASVNLNGLWYSTNLSGAGMDTIAAPELQFNAFYFYDSVGIPRWLVGQTAPFANAGVLTMQQKQGYCPVCASSAATGQAAGTLSVTYANGDAGQVTTAFALQPPLSGRWETSLPLTRLTGSSACTP